MSGEETLKSQRLEQGGSPMICSLAEIVKDLLPGQKNTIEFSLFQRYEKERSRRRLLKLANLK